MRPLGADELMVAARAALLDALDGLDALRDAVVLVGAQAIYLYTGDAPVAIAAFTKDADIALDTRLLADDPLIEEAMKKADFVQNSDEPQPGAWTNKAGMPVDLLIPEAQAGAGGRRSVRVPPHSRTAARRAVGLEGAVVDNQTMIVAAINPGDDPRVFSVRVASPAALLVAKLHKIGERLSGGGLVANKDAHDVYRLLQALPTGTFVDGLVRILEDPLSKGVGENALAYLTDLFASGPDAPGSVLAGKAEADVGDPETVAASVAVLAADLVEALGKERG